MNPYPGPRPFRIDEAHLFSGRRREIDDLHDLVLSYRAVLLYSQSGAGKSSLVSAGLLPEFDERCWLLGRVAGEIFRSEDAANVHTLNLLRTTQKAIGANATLRTALAGHAAQPWLLVLDQFEELFTACPESWQHRELFFRELADLLAADRNVHVLFVIREDFVAELDRFSPYVPDCFRIRYRLERLRESEALQAITEPAAKSSDEAKASPMAELAPDIVKSLLRVPVQTATGAVVPIEGEYVEPVHLQVVCRDVWDRLDKVGSAHVKALTDADHALSSYYDSVLKRIAHRNPLREFRIRLWFVRELITPTGVRGIVFLDAKSGRAAGVPRAIVERLDGEHLIRRVARAGGTWYELTHDRFIEPIQQSNRAYARRWLTRAAGTMAVLVLVALVPIAIAYIQSQRTHDREIEKLNQELATKTADVNTLTNSVERTATETRREYATAATESSRALEEAAAELARAGRSNQAASAYATLGLTQIKIGQAEEGKRHLAAALEHDAWNTVRAVDEYVNVAREARDPAAPALERARRDVLRQLRPYVKQSPQLREYACRNGYVVVGASETLGGAAGELKRFLPRFPNATLGEAYGRQQRIYADMFLSCEQARDVRGAVVAAGLRGDAYIENYFGSVCGACAETAVAPVVSSLTARPLNERCILLSGQLDTGLRDPYDYLAGNWDGSGLSMGVVGFTLRHGDLTRLFAAMKERQPQILQRVFGARQNELLSVMSAPMNRQLEWAASIQTGRYQIAEPWNGLFRGLLRTPEFRHEQLRLATERFYDPALKAAQIFDVRSERGIALMVDIQVQNGGVKAAARDRILSSLAGLRSDLSDDQREVERLQIIANAVADTTIPQFRENVRQRKLAIATGTGTASGRRVNLESDFGIRLTFINP